MRAPDALSSTMIVPAARRVVASATALSVASGAHKVAMFAMRARVGQLGGASALGAVTAALTVTWMIAAFSHLGLPDHALVRAAVPGDDDARRAHARHGLFLGTAALALAASLAATVPGARDPWLAVLLVVGALAQHASGVTLQTLRGRGRPALEAMTLTLASLALGLGAWAATDVRSVAASYAVQGAVFLVALGLGLRATPALRPAWPTRREAAREVRVSLPLFVVGVTAFGLGSADVMATSWSLDDASVGEVTCATMVVRTGFQVPWIVGTLALAGVKDAGPSRMRVVGALAATSAVLAALAGAVALGTGGLAARAFGVPLAQFTAALTWSALLAPIAYVAIVLLPLGMALAVRGTLRATLAAAAATAAASLALARPLGVVGVQLGYALGHLVLAAGLLVALARTTPAEAAR